MMRVRRTISIVIEGDIDKVHEVATGVSLLLPFHHNSDPASGFRYRIEQGEDFLDANGAVIPAADIVAAARADRNSA